MAGSWLAKLQNKSVNDLNDQLIVLTNIAWPFSEIFLKAYEELFFKEILQRWVNWIQPITDILYKYKWTSGMSKIKRTYVIVFVCLAWHELFKTNPRRRQHSFEIILSMKQDKLHIYFQRKQFYTRRHMMSCLQTKKSRFVYVFKLKSITGQIKLCWPKIANF